MSKETSQCVKKNAISPTVSDRDEIRSICIRPSASKAYVYSKSKKKKKECKVLIRGNVQFMQMYSRLMRKATGCERSTLQWKRLKTEIINAGGGKSLKSRIVHGMFAAIASLQSRHIYTRKISPVLLICTMTYSPHYVPCL